MAVIAQAPVREREHERPMSWPRAMLIAIGFFFVTAILVGQLPSYIYTISTLSTLTRFEQGTFDLGLLALGLGLLCLEVALLYDPKPVIPWPLFALVGLVLAVIGAFFLYQITVGLTGASIFTGRGWNGTLPSAGPDGKFWPSGTSYLFHPAWFQQGAVDLTAIGIIALLVGLGMFLFAVLNPFVLGGKLVGPVRDLLVRLSLGLSIVIVAIWLTLYTFVPASVSQTLGKTTQPSMAGNVILFIALMLAVFALQIWLLPIMVANRVRFMPATYLHGMVGLVGNAAVPLLIIWAIVYPVVNAIHNVDPDQIWVQCALKNSIPASCSFTQFTGYIICAAVYGMTFTLLILGLYFWSTRRDTVVLGGTIGLLYLGIAVLIIHTDDPAQIPMALLMATGIAITAFVWTWGTQREFAPTTAQQLGCVGQWLVLGTLAFVYILGFAFFSMPNFFEVEALGLFYQPGKGGLHDAFWVVLLMLGFAGLQFALLIRREPMSNLRKFGMWAMGIGVTGEIIAAIIGFRTDVLTGGVNAMQGGQAFFLTGGLFQLAGILVCLYGALRARSMPWAIAVGASTLIGLAVAIVMHSLPSAYPELVVFGVILASVGAFAYTALGPDFEEGEVVLANGNGNGYYTSRP
jgi:hypothetical protein